MNGRRPDRPPRPLDEVELLNPTLTDALATVGMLIHWATSDMALVTRFARWVEHHPGDLDDDLVFGVLSATHDVLSPGCPDPIVHPEPGALPPRRRPGGLV